MLRGGPAHPWDFSASTEGCTTSTASLRFVSEVEVWKQWRQN